MNDLITFLFQIEDLLAFGHTLRSAWVEDQKVMDVKFS